MHLKNYMESLSGVPNVIGKCASSLPEAQLKLGGGKPLRTSLVGPGAAQRSVALQVRWQVCLRVGGPLRTIVLGCFEDRSATGRNSIFYTQTLQNNKEKKTIEKIGNAAHLCKSPKFHEKNWVLHNTYSTQVCSTHITRKECITGYKENITWALAPA